MNKVTPLASEEITTSDTPSGRLARRARCLVSSRSLVLLVEETLQGSVSAGVVAGVLLPAAPDDEQPGTGQDTDRVGWWWPRARAIGRRPRGWRGGCRRRSRRQRRGAVYHRPRGNRQRGFAGWQGPRRRGRPTIQRSGKRRRQSPISASSRAARILPLLGRLVKI